MNKILCFILLLTFKLSLSLAQKASSFPVNSNLFARTNLHYGFIIPVRESMSHLIKAHTLAYELNIGKSTLGNREWHHIYKYPIIGFSYYHADLGNKDVLGNADAVLPYINFPLYQSPKFLFSFRFACGLGWLSKSFDRIDNYKNNAIGSSLNAAINPNAETSLKISRQILLHANIGLMHFSNGTFRVPNLGINIPSASLGFSYLWNQHNTVLNKQDTLRKTDSRIRFNMILALGNKEAYPPAANKFFTYTFSFTALKTLSAKSRMGLGSDLFYDSSLIYKFEQDSTPINRNSEVLRAGIHLTHELMIARLSIVTQMGTYLISKWKYDGIFYHRLGFKYFFYKDLFANLSLKTHFAKADFVEWGLGYNF